MVVAEAADGTPWPTRNSAEFANVPASWRDDMDRRLSGLLDRHVVRPWFPRTVDVERGGFHSDFDNRWQMTGPDERMLEYQSRQTRSVARLGQAFPSQLEWGRYAEHGLRYLASVMSDSTAGGWYWLIDRDGRPLAEGTKHAHSTAYVIGAFVEVHLLTGESEALDLAQAAFEWLDASLHDDRHGGYHGWATRDGQPIMTRAQVPSWSRDVDPLGHEIGLKDVNVHSDLLESLRLLYVARPIRKVRDRLDEVFEMVEQRFAEPSGRVHYLLEPDLTPVPRPGQPGYAFQTAYRLALAAPILGRDRDAALASARRNVDYSLRTGTAARAGLLEMLDPPERRRRAWWVQTEAVQSLTMLETTVADGSYGREASNLVALIEREMVDERNGGFYDLPVSDRPVRDRIRGRRHPKAHRWKDCSHETDMALTTLRMLRGLRPGEPLES